MKKGQEIVKLFSLWLLINLIPDLMHKGVFSNLHFAEYSLKKEGFRIKWMNYYNLYLDIIFSLILLIFDVLIYDLIVFRLTL
jgi:hypothetical protein